MRNIILKVVGVLVVASLSLMAMAEGKSQNKVRGDNGRHKHDLNFSMPASLYSASDSFLKKNSKDKDERSSKQKKWKKTEELSNPLSSYETFIPLNSGYSLPALEKAAMRAYLDNPSNRQAVSFLVLYHFKRSLLLHAPTASSLKHTIYLRYFLSRLESFSSSDRWSSAAIKKVDRVLASLRDNTTVSIAENHQAHDFFINSFNYHEENRHQALDYLLDDYIQDSTNLHTVFNLVASGLWIGGEAAYDDPITLNAFLLSGYFSELAISMAQARQVLWQEDPEQYPRYRLSSILGGLSVMSRQWLAMVVTDEHALEKLSDEHNQWLNINPAFHAFTVGLLSFESPETFLTGLMAWQGGFADCEARQNNLRTCLSLPRFTFNQLNMFVGGLDFFLKIGDMDTSQFYVSILPYLQNYDEFDLGRDAINHRVENLEEISMLYLNDDPTDDPAHFHMKSRKWGGSTSTCQLCHQAQSKVWSSEEKDQIMLPPEDLFTIPYWPDFTTTWYGSSLEH